MLMPEKIEEIMLAPCGVNCMVCYKHVSVKKHAKSCDGCKKGDDGKPGHCRKCKIKNCVGEKNLSHCFACQNFPCTLVKNLERSYTRRYGVSIINNGRSAKASGLSSFMAAERLKWECLDCGGAFSQHDGICSECGSSNRRGG